MSTLSVNNNSSEGIAHRDTGGQSDEVKCRWRGDALAPTLDQPMLTQRL